MSCTNCDKVKDVSPYAGMHFTIDDNVRHIVGTDGKQYFLDSCLIAKTRKPRGGWGVTVVINGQTINVTGNTSNEIFSNIKNILALNNFTVSDHNLWLNLNIQWLDSAVEKYQRVTLPMLLSLVKPFQEAEESPVRLKNNEWIKRIFGILEIYLSKNTYDHRQFHTLVQTVRSFSNPNSSVFTGNSDIYIILNMEANNLELNPIYEQVRARQWLVDIRNRIAKQIGLPNVTFEQVSQHNHWN